jgi:hypothetical protein
MRRAIITLLVLLSFGLKAQVYQAMPQAGYGPVKRMLFDSVLTIPLNINQLRNITGGRDAGQIRYNISDSGLYVFTGYTWIKANLDSVNLSNRINGKLNISDTAYMLSWYMRKTDTLSLSNRINLRVKYTDTAAMLDPYLRKLDTASLSRRIDEKQNLITLTTNFKSGPSTLIGSTLNIPKYSDTLQDNYVPYVGAIKDVDLGAYQLNANGIKADYLLQVKNTPFSITPTSDYTSITPDKTGFVFYTSWLQGQSTYTQSNRFNYANQAQQNNTREYNLPVRNGTLALVEDTVSLSNRINLKADKATVLTINGVGYDLSANRTWTIPTFDSTSISNRINLKLNISDTASMLSPYLKSAVTSVGLSMPAAFNVTNSPVTSTGTLTVTGAGTAAQYIRGDGQLATLPSGVSGGSSVAYYLNGSVNQGTIGGSVYYEMNRTPVIGAGTDFSLAGNGLISQFITDVADPNRLEIPAGNWNFEMYMSASSSGGNPEFYVELLKYDGTNFTSIASSSANPEAITNGTTIDLYVTTLAIPQTTLLATDRLVIRVYIVNSTGGRTITMHTENSHLCEIITNFAGGVSALNGLTANTQYLAVGTSGNDFAINSLTDTHTFNLPTASSTKRGALSNADWSTFNGKMNYNDTASLSNRINLKLSSSDTVSLSNRINTKLNSTDTASLSNRINAKADALSGITNTVAKFTSSTTIGNSNIKDDGNVVSVSTTIGNFGALQVGSYNGNILMNTTNTNGGLIFQNTSSSNKLWDFSSDNNDLVFNESNVNPVMKLKAGGNVVISNLSGTGTRMVVADANGVLSSQAISSDTTSLSNRINLKLNISDTASMLSPYLRKADTSSLSNRINLKLNISDTASMLSGYQSAINSKQAAITLTTTGTSGAATFTSNTLNIPQYQAAGTYVTSVTGTSPIVSSGGTTPAISIPAATSSVNGYLSSTDWTTFNNKSNTSGTVTSVAALTLGTSGTDLSSTVANGSTTPVITLNVPTASASNRGALSSADWTTFNGKQNALTNPTTGTGTANYHAKFTGSTTLANSLVFDNGTSLGINNITPSYILDAYSTSSSGARLSITGTTNFVVTQAANTSGTFYAGIDDNAGANFTGTAYGRFIYSTGAYPLYFFTNGVIRQTITSSGNVGIGTTSPNTISGYTILDIQNVTNGGLIQLGTNGTGYGQLYNNTAEVQLRTIASVPLVFGTNNTERMRITSGGLLQFSTISTVPTDNNSIYTTSANGLLYIQGGSTGLGLTGSGDRNNAIYINTSTNSISFATNNVANRMTITSGGSVLIGSTTVNTAVALQVYSSGTTSSTYPFSLRNSAGTDNFYIRSDGYGYLQASSWAYGSDRRMKENISDVENGLDMVLKMKPKHFDYINGQKDNLGFIAQDIQEIIPQAVSVSNQETGMLALKTDFLVPYLTKAIQELSAKNEALIKRIETLENK